MATHALTTIKTPPKSVTHGIPRRSLFSAAALLAVAAPARAIENGPDTEFLSTFSCWLPYEEERKQVSALHPDNPAWEARFQAYTDEWHRLMNEMLVIPTRSPAGMHAKAQLLGALLQNHAGFDGDRPDPHASSCEVMAWSLVSDLLAGDAA